MKNTRFALNIAYGQIAVFRSQLPQPLNDWTDRHVSQGFAWRPQSVSFRTLAESGPHTVEVMFSEHLDMLDDEVLRAVEVPFDVDDGDIEIASIADSFPLRVPVGRYLLRAEFFAQSMDEQPRLRLSFATGDEQRFRLSRIDKDLRPQSPLLESAEPAA